MGYYHNGWLLEKEFDEFARLCPWGIKVLGRWMHDDPAMYGGMTAVDYEIYVPEGEEAFDKFFDWFDALLDGLPSQIIRTREAKWQKIMMAIQC